MDQACHCLFATSTFPEDQHRSIDLGQQLSLRPKLSHDRAGSNKEEVITDLLDIFTRDVHFDGVALFGKVSPDHLFKSLIFHWPEDAIPGPEPKSFLSRTGIVPIANHNDRKLRTKSAEPAQEVQSISIGSWQVQNEHVWRYPRLHPLHRSPSIGRTLNLPRV